MVGGWEGFKDYLLRNIVIFDKHYDVQHKEFVKQWRIKPQRKKDFPVLSIVDQDGGSPLSPFMGSLLATIGKRDGVVGWEISSNKLYHKFLVFNELKEFDHYFVPDSSRIGMIDLGEKTKFKKPEFEEWKRVFAEWRTKNKRGNNTVVLQVEEGVRERERERERERFRKLAAILLPLCPFPTSINNFDDLETAIKKNIQIQNQQITQIQAELTATKQNESDKTAKISRLEEKLKLLEKAKTKLEEQITNLEKDLDVKEGVRRRTYESLIEERSRVKEKNEELKLAQEKIRKLEQDIQAKSSAESQTYLAAISQLEKEKEELSTNYQTLLKNSSIKDNEIKRLKRTLESNEIRYGERMESKDLSIEDGRKVIEELITQLKEEEQKFQTQLQELNVLIDPKAISSDETINFQGIKQKIENQLININAHTERQLKKKESEITATLKKAEEQQTSVLKNQVQSLEQNIKEYESKLENHQLELKILTGINQEWKNTFQGQTPQEVNQKLKELEQRANKDREEKMEVIELKGIKKGIELGESLLGVLLTDQDKNIKQKLDEAFSIVCDKYKSEKSVPKEVKTITQLVAKQIAYSLALGCKSDQKR